ncbi:MAG: CDP-diacylglycerol--serine O-phosphatidyltransferase [Bacteroidales bacterium]|nr:CDP-diacylglycerol--serine O-phosphatidyltransferase [Bacteroidales bacterium]
MQIIKHIPNTITCLNLLCGVGGVILSLEGHVETAFLLMLAAAGFDFCDGLAARLLGAYSDIGKELDSLADMVSFGVLPSVLLYKTMSEFTDAPLAVRLIPAILAAFSGLRLAKFNIDERQHESFIGLATPAAAMICGSLAYASLHEPWLEAVVSNVWVVPALAIVLSLLLVSEIPMFAMKMGTGKKVDTKTKVSRIAFLLAFIVSAAVVLSTGACWTLIVLTTFLAYIIINVAASLCK